MSSEIDEMPPSTGAPQPWMRGIRSHSHGKCRQVYAGQHKIVTGLAKRLLSIRARSLSELRDGTHTQSILKTVVPAEH